MKFSLALVLALAGSVIAATSAPDQSDAEVESSSFEKRTDFGGYGGYDKHGYGGHYRSDHKDSYGYKDDHKKGYKYAYKEGYKNGFKHGYKHGKKHHKHHEKHHHHKHHDKHEYKDKKDGYYNSY